MSLRRRRARYRKKYLSVNHFILSNEPITYSVELIASFQSCGDVVHFLANGRLTVVHHFQTKVVLRLGSNEIGEGVHHLAHAMVMVQLDGIFGLEPNMNSSRLGESFSEIPSADVIGEIASLQRKKIVTRTCNE